MKLIALPQEVIDAIRRTNLSYLFGKTEAYEYELKKESRASVFGADLKGKFYSGLSSSKILPEGTKGWLFVRKKIHYSAYKRIGDEDYPAEGADVIETGAYFEFVTLVTLESGNTVLADVFESVDYPARVIGKVPSK